MLRNILNILIFGTFAAVLIMRIAAVSPVKAENKEITIVADLWCPYNCIPDSDYPGFMIEIVQTIFKDNGYSVYYKNMPWEKALLEVYNGVYNAVIGASYNDTKEYIPDFTFPRLPQARTHDCFFTLKEDTWKYTGIPSLIDRKIGIIAGYAYSGIQEYLEQNKDTDIFHAADSQGSPLAENIQRLSAREIDTIIEDMTVFSYKTEQMEISDKFRNAGCIPSGPDTDNEDNVFIAFTPVDNNPDSEKYAKIISKGMVTIRRDGRLAKILKKYGIDDWDYTIPELSDKGDLF